MSGSIEQGWEQRRFPGRRTWVTWLALFLLGSSWLQTWSDDGVAGRILDLTQFLIGQPLFLLAWLLLGFHLWSWALRIRYREALVTGWYALLSLAVLPAAINLVFRVFGLSVRSFPYVAGREWIMTLLTGGWYPHPIASPGLLLTFLTIAWMIGWTVWHWREEKTRAILAGFVSYGAFLLFLSLPSMVAWLGMDQNTFWWNASGYAVQRGIILLSNQQYWWQSLYDRFPGSVSGEAETSERLLLTVVIYLFLVGAWFWWQRRAFLVVWQRLASSWKEAFTTWGAVLFSSAWFGFLWGAHVAVSVKIGFVFALAFLVALSLVGGFLILDASESSGGEERWITLVLAATGAWLLGWPVMSCLVIALIIRYLQRSFVQVNLFPWAQIVLRAGTSVALLLSAWAYGSERGTFADISVKALVGFWLFFVVLELVAADTTEVSSIQDRREGVFCGRLRQGKGLVILLSYAILPLMTGWSSWLLFALPVGCIAAMLSYGRSSNAKKHVRAVATAFLLLSYFFLSIRGFHS